jgi:predicted DNA-binding transcriptional regulator YafY
LERLARLVSLLSVAGPDGVAADHLEAVAQYETDNPKSRRSMLHRDLQHLVDGGWLIDNVATDGVSAHYRLRSVDHRLQVRLTAEQRAALQGAAMAASRQDLLGRIGLRPDGDAAPDVLVQAPHIPDLDLVLTAVRERCPVRFAYSGRDRVVHPQSVRTGPTTWYLIGVEEEDDDSASKSFAVSRMREVTLLEPGSARPLPDPEPRSFDPLSWAVDPPIELVLVTTPEHDADVAMVFGPPQARVLDEEGSVTLTIEVVHWAAARHRIYELGDRVRVAGPAAFRDAMLLELARVAGEPLAVGPGP